MAGYTVTTNREQELGLNWQYDNYVNHETYPTKDAWFQSQVNARLLDPMFSVYEKDHAIALDASLDTIPEANQAAAQQEIQAVIIAHGGTIVAPVPPLPPTLLVNLPSRF
jgi:hypothetical protein